MKVLIVGSGWIGTRMQKELNRRGHTITISTHTNVFDILAQEEFDWVINCAGVTGIPNIDACEKNKSETYLGNTVFPIQLHHIVSKTRARLAHVSSGCIYEGTIDDINALPNFFGSTYSISKGISDTYLKDKAQVYRIRLPFTGIDEPKNFLAKILKYAKTGKLFDGGHNSITDLDEAIEVACTLVETDAPNGPYNLVNRGSITMHEIVDMIGVTANWYTEEEFKNASAASRPNCIIPSHPAMSSVKDALQNALSTLLEKTI